MKIGKIQITFEKASCSEVIGAVATVLVGTTLSMGFHQLLAAKDVAEAVAQSRIRDCVSAPDLMDLRKLSDITRITTVDLGSGWNVSLKSHDPIPSTHNLGIRDHNSTVDNAETVDRYLQLSVAMDKVCQPYGRGIISRPQAVARIKSLRYSFGVTPTN